MASVFSKELDAEFGRIKAGQIKRLKMAQKNPRLWTKVRLMYSSFLVAENKAIVDLVLGAPEDLLNQAAINTIHSTCWSARRLWALRMSTST